VSRFLIATIVATAAVASAAAVIPVVLALSFLRHSAYSIQPVGVIFRKHRGRALDSLDAGRVASDYRPAWDAPWGRTAAGDT
jgi:hypothetical protein